MNRAGPWLLRLGALLILISPLVPQGESGGGRVSAGSVTSSLAGKTDAVERLAAAAGLFAPVLAGLLILAGASLPGGGPALLRLATLGLLLAVSFALSTLGSLLLTDTATRAVTPSFPLSIALFAGPLLLTGTALARWMQKGLHSNTGSFERLALALLMILHGLFLVDSGWSYLLLPEGIPNGTVRSLPGAWIGPLGGLIALVGGVLGGLPPRSPVDTAAASG
ncbi:MAG TPA: hypothetical protein VKW04_12195 [Planctomycetota bacterium]|nr:hypothetical protein [Planctomycetota bacterium]